MADLDRAQAVVKGCTHALRLPKVADFTPGACAPCIQAYTAQQIETHHQSCFHCKDAQERTAQQIAQETATLRLALDNANKLIAAEADECEQTVKNMVAKAQRETWEKAAQWLTEFKGRKPTIEELDTILNEKGYGPVAEIKPDGSVLMNEPAVVMLAVKEFRRRSQEARDG